MTTTSPREMLVQVMKFIEEIERCERCNGTGFADLDECHEKKWANIKKRVDSVLKASLS